MTVAPARRWRVGGVLVAVYLAAAIVTGGRPLFDGFAPPAPYRWVKPPPELATDNQPPQAADRTIPLGAGGSEAANASTTDAQIIVTLPQGAIAAHPPDTAVLLKITPLDVGALGVGLPRDLRAVSNAYQVTLADQPSGAAVASVDPSTIIALTAASNSDGLLYLAPGSQQWEVIPSRAFGNTHGQTGPFKGAGAYVVTASPSVTDTTVPGTKASGGSGGMLIAGVALVAVGVLLAVGRFVMLRRRAKARRTRQQRRNQARRRRP